MCADTAVPLLAHLSALAPRRTLLPFAFTKPLCTCWGVCVSVCAQSGWWCSKIQSIILASVLSSVTYITTEPVQASMTRQNLRYKQMCSMSMSVKWNWCRKYGLTLKKRMSKKTWPFLAAIPLYILLSAKIWIPTVHVTSSNITDRITEGSNNNQHSQWKWGKNINKWK